jgi:outer membrane protein assembly factor BamD (BamD/ComL family)
MRRGLTAVPLLLLLASACAPVPREPGSSTIAARLVARADDLAARGQARAAHALYERVLREHPGDPAGAAALYGVGRLEVDPTSGLRNYRAAHATFVRLLSEYPTSPWEPEARAWRAVLGDLLTHEDETAQLKAQIDRLRRTDLELEHRR